MVNVDHARRPSLAGRGLSQAAKVVVRGPQLLSPLLPVRAGALLARAVLLLACTAGFVRTLPHMAIDVTGPRGRLRGEWVGVTPEPGRPVLYFLHGSGYVGCPRGPIAAWSASCRGGWTDRPSAWTIAARRSTGFPQPTMTRSTVTCDRRPRGSRNRPEQFTTAMRDRRDRRSPPRRVRASRPSHAARR